MRRNLNTLFFKRLLPVLGVVCMLMTVCSWNYLDNSKKLVWNKSSISVFKPQHSGAGGFYPRMIILKNEDWLVAYDTNDGNVVTRCQISRSSDKGRTWKVLSVASFGNGNAANAQMLQLKNGDLLLAYRMVEGDNKKLKVSKSSDNGATWKELSTIADATMDDYRGVWEPHLGYLPDGKIAVMYASEVYQPDFPQVIEMKVSSDSGKTWGEPIRVSGFESSRDGMPVWTVTKDKKVMVVFEATDDPTGIKPFVIRCKVSADGYNWPEKRQLLYSPRINVARAAAPFIITLSNGSLAVSAQTDYNPTGYDMHVLLSTDNGKHWLLQTPPFATKGDDMWNALYPLPDGGVAALTSTNDEGDSQIKIRIGYERTAK